MLESGSTANLSCRHYYSHKLLLLLIRGQTCSSELLVLMYCTFASCRTLLFHFHLFFPSFVRLIDVFLNTFSVINTLSLFKL
jgi:hypothetical protein